MDIIIKRKPVSLPVLPIAAAAVLLVLLLTTMRVGRIQANEIGVFVNNLSGSVTVNTQPGASLYNGWITDFYVLDNTEQSYRMAGSDGLNDSVNIKTRDGADVKLDVVINYRLTSDVDVIRNRVIPECGLDRVAVETIEQSTGRARRVRRELDAYKVKWIRDYARSVVRYKFGELTPTSFAIASERNSKARESVEELNRLLRPHGIDVRLVVPERFSFYPELEQMINEKKAASQEVEAQESKATAALEAQKRDVTRAVAEKTAAVTRMAEELKQEVLKIEAEAERELKAAEAYAYATRTAADADFYKAKNEARSILLKASAEAEGMKKLAASLEGEGGVSLVELEYARRLAEATIRGVPYATDPRIQKLQLEAPKDEAKGGGR